MDVFDLYAKLSLDTSEYDESLKDAGNQASVFGDVLKADLVGKGISLAITGLQKLGEAAVNTFKQSIEAYAETEQLLGGSELVFGKAYDFIIKKSKEAYKSVQMSQNEYLTQVNGLAVGLKNALDGDEEAAAQLADKIITAEADVVAALGISQEAAQNAFNGIMRGNYTMVDNLGLGLKATQEGMQEMIDKVNEWNATQGRTTEYTLENVADIQNALVDYIEMQGLAGYAQREATDTISGSIASLKAAWNNLVAGIADDNADIDKLLDDLVEAANKVWDKIEPVALAALDNLMDIGIAAIPKFGELGLKIAWAIFKAIITSPLKLIAKLLEKLGLIGQNDTFDKYDVSYRANGGSALSDRAYIAGELGPELVVPGTTSHVYTAEETAGILGRSGNITINIQGDVYDDEYSMERKMRNAVRDVIDTELAYG